MLLNLLVGLPVMLLCLVMEAIIVAQIGRAHV